MPAHHRGSTLPADHLRASAQGDIYARTVSGAGALGAELVVRTGGANTCPVVARRIRST